MPSDMNWFQLETAAGNTGFITHNPTDGIIMIPSKLTGDTYASISSEGVVEFMYKLHLLCSTAQSQINTGVAGGERLAAFPPFSASAPVSGFVTVTQSIISRIPLNPNSVIGPVN